MKRLISAAFALAFLSFAGAASAATCAATTTPNTSGVTANSQYEMLIEVCERVGTVVRATATPTVTASSAYASGNNVGGLLTFTSVGRTSTGTGLLQDITVNFKSAQTAQLDFVWCGSDTPSSTTVTDKSAAALAVADFDKCRVIAHITDCTSMGTPSSCIAQGLAVPVALASGTSGYGWLITRGTPTFTATSDVKVSLGILRN